MDIQIETVPTDWKTLVSGIVADKYDLTTSASLNMQRAKAVGYSEPYVYYGTVSMTLKKNLVNYSSWGSINPVSRTCDCSSAPGRLLNGICNDPEVSSFRLGRPGNTALTG